MASVGTCGQIGYGFQGRFTFKREARTFNLLKWYKRPILYPFLLALMPEPCVTTKLDKDFLLNAFRRGLKNLDAVTG